MAKKNKTHLSVMRNGVLKSVHITLSVKGLTAYYENVLLNPASPTKSELRRRIVEGSGKATYFSF